MDIINANIYLPSYNESQINQINQINEIKIKKKIKSKDDKPPKYSPSQSHTYIIQDNIVHPYIMQEPTNTIIINVREPIVLSSRNGFNSTRINRRNTRRNQHQRSDSYFSKLCECYKKESNDSRCCGLCYYICPLTPEEHEEQNICNICPKDLDEYVNSCYCKTTDLPNSPDDCLCTTFCCPVKFPLFITCFLGSIFNSYINCCCSTNKNYLF